MENRLKVLLFGVFVVLATYYTVITFPSRPHVSTGRFAFATLLSNFTSAGDASRHSVLGSGETWAEDGYFLGTRYLNYVLGHRSETKSKYPLLILATAEVEEEKINRLRREGAEVMVIDSIAPPDWMSVGDIRYNDVLTKFRLWEMTSYDKICFIDADVLVMEGLDDVFQDPATEPRYSESGMPYTFAAQYETTAYNHAIPPWNWGGYANAGFVVLSPSKDMYNMYMTKLRDHGGDWPGYFPEQDLMNDIHNMTGPMPWQVLDGKWNVHYPTEKDLKAGVKSFHDKFWEENQDILYSSDPALRKIWREQVVEMESFYKHHYGL